MSSKTKIVVLHVKELIYTGIFVVLGILFLVLLIVMFLPDKKENQETMAPGVTEETVKYVPGVYTTSLILNGNVVEIEVTVDEYNINSVRLKNLDDAVTTMYPLLEPAFDNLATQIVENQSLSNLTFPEENQYTSMVLEEAIYNTFEKAKAEDNTTK
ncbi:MAG: hypothetical protein SOW50_12655 [Lachnospiraceae bacterium]|nr:hypothetical protein [Clostridiales bacterium]MDY3110951.1 hypothetical protein [Lachnospiraceae bacterium]